MDQNSFIVTDEKGIEIEYEIVLTFKNDETHKSYVIYKMPGEDNEEVFAASYDELKTDGGDLEQIKTDREWEIIEEVLNAFIDEEDEE